MTWVIDDDTVIMPKGQRYKLSNVCNIKYNKTVRAYYFIHIKGDLTDERLFEVASLCLKYGADIPLREQSAHNLEGGVIMQEDTPQDVFEAAASYLVENSAQGTIEAMKANPELRAAGEIRMKCNVCGSIYCYTIDDLKANVRNAAGNLAGSVVQLGGIATGNIGTAIYGKQNTTNQVVDYNRCPNCKSTDVSRYDSGAEKSANQLPNQSAQSSADEIRKFKELLDEGIISQEEFDAKKKDLLGL